MTYEWLGEMFEGRGMPVKRAQTVSENLNWREWNYIYVKDYISLREAPCIDCT